MTVDFEHLFPVTAPTTILDEPRQRFQGGPIVLAGPMESKR
jgi:uronate dehydrogenase